MSKTTGRPSPPGHAKPPGRAAYLALGDSYTIGEGVDPDERWTDRLAALLRKKGIDVAPPITVARTGWTTGELLEGLDSEDYRAVLHPGQAASFDLVSLLIGVNDQYRGRDAEEYRPTFRAVLERAVKFARGAAGRVVVLSIPDWGLTPFAEGRDRARIALEIDRFNAVNRAETETVGARYVEITRHSRAAGAAGMALLVTDDGLHPSGALYAAWARLALPHALAALSTPQPNIVLGTSDK